MAHIYFKLFSELSSDESESLEANSSSSSDTVGSFECYDPMEFVPQPVAQLENWLNKKDTIAGVRINSAWKNLLYRGTQMRGREKVVR